MTQQGLRQASVRARFDAKYMPEPNSGCWLWTGAALPSGYGQFKTAGHNLAHRYSYEVHHGPIPSGLCVLHHCDNPACVNPDHLWAGTHRDNAIDKVIKGRARGNAGVGNHLAKLDPEKAAWACQALAYGMSANHVAAVLGVNRTTILKIVRGETWRGNGGD